MIPLENGNAWLVAQALARAPTWRHRRRLSPTTTPRCIHLLHAHLCHCAGLVCLVRGSAGAHSDSDEEEAVFDIGGAASNSDASDSDSSDKTSVSGSDRDDDGAADSRFAGAKKVAKGSKAAVASDSAGEEGSDDGSGDGSDDEDEDDGKFGWGKGRRVFYNADTAVRCGAFPLCFISHSPVW